MSALLPHQPNNPNPRGFRLQYMFVDLDRVDMVTRTRPEITNVYFSGRSEATIVLLSEESHELFLNALELYKSGG